MSTILQVKKLVPEAQIPKRGSVDAAGFDLYAAKGTVIPKGRIVIRTEKVHVLLLCFALCFAVVSVLCPLVFTDKFEYIFVNRWKRHSQDGDLTRMSSWNVR